MIQNIWELRGTEKHKQKRRAQTSVLYLDPTSNDIILDVGCAEGFFTKYLVKANKIIGLDISISSLLIFKNKIINPNIECICADASFLPFKKGSFDKITSLELLEHLPKNIQQRVILEFDRILKETGKLLISVPYKENIIYTNCIHCGKQTPLWGHLHSMKEEDIKELLPKEYVLLNKCNLPNVGLISLSLIFENLPIRLWLTINKLLGKIRKGYWLLLKYKKKHVITMLLKNKKNL